ENFPRQETRMDPTKLLYTKTHEWSHFEGDLCTIGISKFAADQLSDVTFVELPHVGDHVFRDKEFGQIETVKAVSDLYAPIDGEVIAVNNDLIEDPAPLTADPFGAGWLIKLRVEPNQSRAHLLDHGKYQQQVASEGH